jgi:hypothetical protein
MKRITCVLALAVVAVFSGCQAGPLARHGCPGGLCGHGAIGGEGGLVGGYYPGPSSTQGGPSGFLAHLHGRDYRGAQASMGQQPGPADGPPAPTVVYPYYTVRGPRDFLAKDPPSIGR